MHKGREFGDRRRRRGDRERRAGAAAVGRRAAIGRRIKFGDKPWRTVHRLRGHINGGVVGTRPEIRLRTCRLRREPGKDLALMISTDRDPASLASDLRAAVRAMDPDQRSKT